MNKIILVMQLTLVSMTCMSQDVHLPAFNLDSIMNVELEIIKDFKNDSTKIPRILTDNCIDLNNCYSSVQYTIQKINFSYRYMLLSRINDIELLTKLLNFTLSNPIHNCYEKSIPYSNLTLDLLINMRINDLGGYSR